MKSIPSLSLNIKRESRFGDYGYDPIYIPEFGEMTVDQKEQALAVVDSFMQPMPISDILKGIARLQVCCPEREASEYDKKARATIYAEELYRYPADVVEEVLHYKYKWFPSLGELKENCDNLVAYRNLIKQGINCALLKK